MRSNKLTPLSIKQSQWRLSTDELIAMEQGRGRDPMLLLIKPDPVDQDALEGLETADNDSKLPVLSKQPRQNTQQQPEEKGKEEKSANLPYLFPRKSYPKQNAPHKPSNRMRHFLPSLPQPQQATVTPKNQNGIHLPPIKRQ